MKTLSLMLISATRRLITSTLRRICRIACEKHQTLQLLAYEGGNLALALSESLNATRTNPLSDDNVSVLTLSSCSFAAMSALLCANDCSGKAAVYGGLCGIAGGLYLASAGFLLTGIAVIISSLELSRGGFNSLGQFSEAGVSRTSRPCASIAAVVAAACGIEAYATAVSHATRAMNTRFLDDHPFIVRAGIKAPLRLDMILQCAGAGAVIQMWVGVSWLAGDLFVALNDRVLREKLLVMRP